MSAVEPLDVELPASIASAPHEQSRR